MTVIATGIGEKGAIVEPAEPIQDKSKCAGKVGQPLRGKVRDVAPEDSGRDDIVDLDEPTFIRKQRAAGWVR